MIKTMRTKKLMIAALAMPLAFAACTNEEFAEINNSQVLESENVAGEKMVVGKELIADGAVIKLEHALSRVTGADFDVNDKLGFAWFLNPVANDEADADLKTILDTQDTKDFTYNKNKIYNNYLIQKNSETGDFEVNGEMYAGAYFMYYPYQKIGMGNALSVDYSTKIKNTQTKKIVSGSEVEDEFLTNSLSLSHKMTFSQAKEDFKLEVKSAPCNTMNVFAVKPTLLPEGDVYEASKTLLNGIKIQRVEISVGEKVFANKAEVDLRKLPKANSGKWDAKKTRELIEQTVISTASEPALVISSRLNKLTTYVENGNTLADEDLGYILLSTFATEAPSPTFKKEATVNVYTNVGSFECKLDENSELIKRLTDNEYEKYLATHTNIITAVPVNLDMAKFKLTTTNISKPEDWNYLMKLIDAQGGTVTKNVSVKNLVFTDETPMELPENVKINVTSGNITFASGDQTIGKEFTTQGQLIVNEGATLNLNADVTAGELVNNGTTIVDAVLTTDLFTNNAEAIVTVNAGNKGINPAGTATYTNNGTINCHGNIGGKVINNNGVINVTYGATVVMHNSKGVVHGILDATANTEIANNQVKAIWQMIGNLSTVNCNSLELIGFELSEGDKYQEWGGSEFEIQDATFQKVNVKLVNSTLSKEADAACEFLFNGLTLENSTVTGDIESKAAVVAEGSTVTGDLNASGKEVKLSASTVTGDVTGAAITLESTEVTGDVNGTTITIDGGSITGDVTASKDFTIEDATVNGKLNVTGQMTINNSTVTATNGSSFASGLVAENSTLEGSFIGLTKNVELTNCTINASEITTTKDLVINANGVAFNINNTVLEAYNVTFNGNKNVVFNNTTLEAGSNCYVNTNITGKGACAMSAYDYIIAPKKSIGFNYVEK